MPIIILIGGIKIYVFSNEHLPPHVHAVYAEFEALIGIKNCTVIEGYLPKNILKKVIAKVEEKRKIILVEFYSLNPQITEL